MSLSFPQKLILTLIPSISGILYVILDDNDKSFKLKSSGNELEISYQENSNESVPSSKLDSESIPSSKLDSHSNSSTRLTQSSIHDPNRLVPDHAFKYPKFHHYTWLIFRDTLLNKPCFIVTNSKYPMLQEYRWCIPFSGIDDDINDSFHGSVAMNYADHKVCKEGSKKQPSNGESRYTYCSRMFNEVKQQAERENWASFSEICRTNNDAKIQEFCGYMF